MKIGLNVGSGQRPFKSTPEVRWINVDSQEKWSPDLVCDGAHLPYEDGSVDYFVLHHVLEHFGCGEASGLITESYRVLKPGGSLFVFVPDLKELAQGWFAGKISTQIYMTNLYGAYMGSEDDRHKWGFDKESLESFLFTEPYHTTWGWIGNPSIIPPGADAAHDWWILEMECVK